MNKQRTVDSKVLAILRECPETRYDDMQLILCYYNRYSYLKVGDLSLENIVNNYKGYGLPCFETIRRSRQRCSLCSRNFPDSAVAATAVFV